MIRFILLLLSISVGQAATYYVATNGNNAASGAVDAPWSNVWYAAKTAVAGDTVRIGPGEFNEFVTNTISGSSGSPITFTGTRGSAGEWLTIIDPSTPVTNGWTAAPDIGAGVYRNTNLSFTTRELTLNHLRVPYVWTNGYMASDVFYNTNWTTGEQIISQGPDTMVAFGAYPTVIAPMWDGIEAIWMSTNKVLYLHLRDGSDPNGLDLRAAPNSETSPVSNSAIAPAIQISYKNFIVWSNVCVRGGYIGINMQWSHDITVVSNYVCGGFVRIYIIGGSLTYNNLIKDNDVYGAWYGLTNLGAWTGGLATGNTIYNSRFNTYGWAKYMMGHSSSWCDGIYINQAGSNNIICGNHIYQGVGNDISLEGNVTSPSSGCQVYNNLIERSSSVGLILQQGFTSVSVFSNRFDNNNSNVRCHHLDYAGETNRTIYFYRNLSWQPDDVGEHVFFYYIYSAPASYFPTIWFYHNSFSGGSYGFVVNAQADDAGGITNGFILNNIISDCIWEGNAANTTNFFGACDYNLIYPELDGNLVWFGSHNITNTGVEWVNSSGMSFAPKAGSLAINSALNIHNTFTLNGRTFSALPDTITSVGTAWDMGALEAGTVAQVKTIRGGRIKKP